MSCKCKKVMACLLALCLFLGAFSSVAFAAEAARARKIPVRGITLSAKKATLNAGKTAVLKAKVTPASASNKKLAWSSSNRAVATVSSAGKVKAIGAGKAIITCKSTDGSNKTASCAVTVVSPVKKIVLSPKRATLTVGGTITVRATVTPANAGNKKVAWSSGNAAVATVSSAGKVTAKGAGRAVITCKAKDGSGKKATCVVTVQAADVPVSAVTLDAASKTISVGQSAQLTATVSPGNATDKRLNWTSSAPNVATVTASGLVTAVSAGSAVITCASVSNPAASAACQITVPSQTTPVSAVTLDAASKTISVGQSAQLTATVSPGNATDKRLNWTSSAPNVATVTASGLVTAVSEGAAIVFCASVENPAIWTYCQIAVESQATPVAMVALDAASKAISVGQTALLTATVSPANATDKRVSWTSDDSGVATVSASGLVRAVSAGSAVITCASVSNPNASAVCQITVTNGQATPVSAVTLDAASKTISVGQSAQLTATVSPDNATDKRLNWTSSAPNVATVSENGLVTAVSAGSAVVTCASVSNPNVSAACQITVTNGQATPVYRLLTITQEDYSSGALYGPHNDGIAMRNIYNRFNLGGVQFAKILSAKDFTGQGLYNALADLPSFYGFTDPIKEDDITIFYYSGHGAASDTKEYRGALCGVDGRIVTVDTVQKLLDKVPGTVVVILDSCLSGQYITSKGQLVQAKSLPTEADAQAYNAAVLQAFARSTATSKALTDSPVKKKYKILTAAAPLQSSWAVGINDYPFGIFTYYIAKGAGLDVIPNKETKMYADASGDGKVSLQEMYTYVDTEVKNYFSSATKQNAQVWPANDPFTLYAR